MGNLLTLAAGIASGLGTLVWWDLHDTLITPDDLRKVYADNGFDASRIPNIDHGRAVRDAVARWKINGYQTEWLGLQDDGKLLMGLLERVRDETKNRVDRLQRVRITFDPTTGDWETQTSPGGSADTEFALSSFITYAKRRCVYLDHNWIRPQFLKRELAILDSFLVKSGMYYIPTVHNDTVLRLQAAVAAIGSSHLFILEVPDTGQARHSVGSSAQDAILADVQIAVEKLEAWRDRMSEEGARKVRSYARLNMMQSFVELRDRASLYATALRFELGDIEAMISKTEDQAAEFFAEMDAVEDDDAPAGADKVAEEQAPTEISEPESSEPEITNEFDAAELAGMKRPRISEIAKQLNIKGRGRMKLDELRVAILANQEARAAA